MESVEVEHEWTHERQTIRVERITMQKLIVSFPVIGSGRYEIDLHSNRMRSTSPAIRRKHPFCLWRAADIAAIRRSVWAHFHPEQDAVKKSYERHEQTMPLAKKSNANG